MEAWMFATPDNTTLLSCDFNVQCIVTQHIACLYSKCLKYDGPWIFAFEVTQGRIH